MEQLVPAVVAIVQSLVFDGATLQPVVLFLTIFVTLWAGDLARVTHFPALFESVLEELVVPEAILTVQLPESPVGGS